MIKIVDLVQKYIKYLINKLNWWHTEIIFLVGYIKIDFTYCILLFLVQLLKFKIVYVLHSNGTTLSCTSSQTILQPYNPFYSLSHFVILACTFTFIYILYPIHIIAIFYIVNNHLHLSTFLFTF